MIVTPLLFSLLLHLCAPSFPFEEDAVVGPPALKLSLIFDLTAL